MPEPIARPSDPILITGSSGFIGSRVVQALLAEGFTNLRCLVRNARQPRSLASVMGASARERVAVLEGNLLSADDCRRAVDGVTVIFHLAAARGDKSYPSAYLNSVVTTRNLLEAASKQPSLRRIVCVSSFTVYSTTRLGRGRLLDESCEMEAAPHRRGEAYCYAKVRQEQCVREYGRDHGIPYVIVRPGVVYGPGNAGIPGRVGLSNFGIFLHLGGGNELPLTYVDNCADAIVLAGLTPGVDGEVFNVVDDDLPTSRAFLALYKRHVGAFSSVSVPRPVSYGLSYLWERYSEWSEHQLPAVFNRSKWAAYWKGHRYCNARTKARLGWTPRLSCAEGMQRYFESERRSRRSS